MKKILLAFVASLALSPLMAAQSTAPVFLNQRQPNWRMEIVKAFQQGNPQVIVFYEPRFDEDVPVKQMIFNEKNLISVEMDIAQVDAESTAAKEWNATLVPHGTRVEFSPEGQL